MKWLLGEELQNSKIQADGVTPIATWKAKVEVKRWGITWKKQDDGFIQLGLIVEVKSTMICPVEVLAMAVDDAVCGPFDVVLLIRVSPLKDGDEPKVIAVVFNSLGCAHEMCCEANDKGMQFALGFPDDEQELLDAYAICESNKHKVNKAIADQILAEKPPAKKGRAKKTPALPSSTTEMEIDTEETGESSKRAVRAKGKGKAPAKRGEKGTKSFTLGEAIQAANSLSTKTPEADVQAMYKALDDGLGHCFPYGHKTLPDSVPASRIHIAPDSIKYRSLVKERLEQVSVFYKGFGPIRKKPELYCLPLKRMPNSLADIGVIDEGLDLVMDSVPARDATVTEGGRVIPWFKAQNVHWYIIGGQHTFEVCNEIAAKEVVGSEKYELYTNHEIIPIFSKNADILVKVSNALNVSLKDKEAGSSFRSIWVRARAKWIEHNRPSPSKGGKQHEKAFKVSFRLRCAICFSFSIGCPPMVLIT